MSSISRRSFLQASAFGAAAMLSARSWGQVAGANDDIRIAVIGFRWRGGEHINILQKLKGVRITALCDCDTEILDKWSKAVPGAAKFTDIRKLLESKEIDAVSIATPNHWHALATIWAIQAGKDVYVEKPVSHNISEGRRMVEFARLHNRIVQAGTQSRSSREGIGQAVEYVKSGKLGKIKVARGLCYKRRKSIGKSSGPLTPPATVDLDLWTGPAAMEPLVREKFHYDWHWFWNTGNGDLGNQGVHEMDVARWFLGTQELSPSIITVGGRVGYVDDGQTPNTLISYHDFPAAPLIFEVRGLPAKSGSEKSDTYKGAGIGIVIECEGGYVSIGGYGGAKIYDSAGKLVTEFKGSENHHGNFLAAMRSRKYTDLNADILEGHLSAGLCHTSNISYQLGKQSSQDETREAIKANPSFSETYDRLVKHLAANGIDVSKDKLVLGTPLKMDPKTETFVDNDAANAMLTRPYRAGFVVPAKAV